MARARKFIKGAIYTSAMDAAADIYAGRWIYLNHKVTHPGWASGWSLTTLRNLIGHLYRAIPNPAAPTTQEPTR